MTGETKKLTETLTAVNTKIGWTLHGSSFNSGFSVNLQVCNNVNVLHIQEYNEEFNLQKFWDLESIGIKEDTVIAKEVTSQFIENKITFNGDRYEVCLPWSKSSLNLDSNYDGALSRLKSLVTKLSNDLKLIEYDEVMQEYFKNGCAELAPLERIKRAYYMPHRAVYKQERDSTKVRIVFDASAHAKNLSFLNEVLDPGENLVLNYYACY